MNFTQNLTTDQQIRTAFRGHLYRFLDTDAQTIIIEELGLKHGRSRIDLVAINGVMHGFELKSDKDSLDRLPDQCSTYNAILDQVTLVCAQRHLSEAMDIIPLWWGLIEVRATNNGKLKFRVLREPGTNRNVDIFSAAKLLWREEALELLDQLGGANGVRSKPRIQIYERIAQTVSLEELRKKIKDSFMKRANWRSVEPQILGGG